MITVLAVVVGVAAVALGCCMGIARPELRTIAARNLRSRPGRALLVATGVVLATATISSAAVVGDSLRSSIRRSANTQLGPVDEEVIGSGIDTARSVAATLENARLNGVDGVLPLLTIRATVRGRDFVPRVAQAQLIEVDFARATDFGGDRSRTGISGPTPTGTGAAMNVDLSQQIAIGVGHRVTVYAYGTSRTFRIARVLPRIGLAGLQSRGAPIASASPNLFVAPGTLASMRNETRQQDAPAPTSIVAISNRDDASTSRRAGAAVSAALRNATQSLPVEVVPVKQLLLQDATRLSNDFGRIFRVFGTFTVLGGLLLLLLTFSALALERARSLGILRALGLGQRDMAVTLILEALFCCVIGAAIGTVVGAGIGALVVLVARGLLSNAAAGRIELSFAAPASTFVVPATVGLVISLAVLTVTAVVVSHHDVIALTRGDPALLRGPRPHTRRVLGVIVCGTGVALAAAGIIVPNTVAAVAGAAGTALGVTVAVGPRPRSLVAALGSAGVLVWTIVEVGRNHRAFSGPAPVTLITAAAIMSFAALTLLVVTSRGIVRRFSQAGRRQTAPIALGFAYSEDRPARTATISAMYAVVVFTLCFVLIVAHLYAGNVDTVARQLGGRAALEVTSNAAQPLPARDVAQVPGVARVVGASALDVHLASAVADSFRDVTLIGFDASFLDHGTPPIIASVRDLPSGSVYERVAADPTLVVVGADLDTTAQGSLDHRAPHVGDTIQLQDPTSGEARKVRIAALVANARYQGIDHIYGSNALAAQLHRARVPPSVLYVETAPGTNNDTVAAIIDGTHLQNGAYARSFRRLARDRLGAQAQFLNILAGYTALGLVAGTVALAVAMIDRVRERRRQLATLRAIGCRPSTLRRALRIEAAVISLGAIVAGLVAAALLAWRITATGALGETLTFSIPGAGLSAVVVVVLVGALAATSVAARRAGRLEPASALRVEE